MTKAIAILCAFALLGCSRSDAGCNSAVLVDLAKARAAAEHGCSRVKLIKVSGGDWAKSTAYVRLDVCGTKRTYVCKLECEDCGHDCSEVVAK